MISISMYYISFSYVDGDELLKESSDDRENVRRKFLVDMPEDFYLFWEFCKTLEPTNPRGIYI